MTFSTARRRSSFQHLDHVAHGVHDLGRGCLAHPEGDPLPRSVGMRDPRPSRVEVRSGPHTAVRIEGVRTQRLVPLEVRRQDLTRRGLGRRGAEQIQHLTAIDREIQGPTHRRAISSFQRTSPRRLATAEESTKSVNRTAPNALEPERRRMVGSSTSHRGAPVSNTARANGEPESPHRPDEVVRERMPAEAQRDHVGLDRARRSVLPPPAEAERGREREWLHPIPVVPRE